MIDYVLAVIAFLSGSIAQPVKEVVYVESKRGGVAAISKLRSVGSSL
jgi:hypothetical protein